VNDLTEAFVRRGFDLSQAPAGDSAFDSAPVGAIGACAALPTRVDEGRDPGDGAPLFRVRFGLAATDGDPKAVTRALDDANVRVAAGPAWVEVLAAPEHTDDGSDGAWAYVEGLAHRAAAAIDPAPPAPAERARPLTVHGYPQWVEAAEVDGVEEVQLRHLELNDGRADWGDLGVRLEPTADGAIIASGTWPEEAPFISLMGRMALMRSGEDGRQGAVLLGSGVCTLTNRRLVGVAYARPDDDVLQGIGDSMARSGITITGRDGRPTNPFSAMSEERKALQFIDGAGAIDTDGGGTVLALSASPQAFAGVELGGSMLQRGFGIPEVRLNGGPLELRVIPFRVLDGELHTVKPRLGQIKRTVGEWWTMTSRAGA
jgi:hypothetical protein